MRKTMEADKKAKGSSEIARALCAAMVALACAGPLMAQAPGSWGDGQASGVRESSSTSRWEPGRYAIDGDVNTAWRLETGKTNGWLERYWSQEKRLASLELNLSLPEKVQIQVFAQNGTSWTALPGGVVDGPFDGRRVVSLPGAFPALTAVLVRLSGENADGARLYELSSDEREGPAPFHKIQPKSFSFNIAKSITIDPERLWDGTADDSWYEPLWSLPYEISRILKKADIDAVFPAYTGHPAKAGEIVWELDGEQSIETLKTYFIQDGRRIAFDYWSGTKWVPAGDIWGAKGWHRIDLGGVKTTRLRLSFPGGWDQARFIGEVEAWGEGRDETKPVDLVVPGRAQDGTYWMTAATGTANDLAFEFVVSGSSIDPLPISWNGAPMSAAAVAWAGGDTEYRVEVSKESLRTDAQFLNVKTARRLEGARLQRLPNDGRIDLGWPWNDGRYETAEGGPGMSSPPITEKTWNLPGVYELERIRVYAPYGNSLRFSTANGALPTEISWTSTGSGWYEAELDGRAAKTLIATSDVPAAINEIELYGSSLSSGKPRIEAWWPKPKVGQTGTDGAIVGWLGNAGDAIAISGFGPRHQDHLFWMPLSEMGMAAGQEVDSELVASNPAGTIKRALSFPWAGTKAEATLSQGEGLASTTASSIALNGTVLKKDTRLFVQGVETGFAGYAYSVSVPLAEGYQVVKLEFWDKNKKRLLERFEKPVWKPARLPDLAFDLPAGDVNSQLSSLDIAGRAANGTGLSLARGSTKLSLDGQSFGEILPLSEGSQTATYTLTDAAGQSASFALTIERDAAAPSISILQPTPGQFLADSAVTLQATSPTDELLWWKFNDDPWEPGNGRIKTRIENLADGYYSYRIYAQDRSGNVSAPATASFCVDTAPPSEFAIAANVSGWTNNNRPTLSFSTTDATSGLSGYEYGSDGAWLPASSPFKVPELSDGIHTAFIAAIDRGGNRRTEGIELKIDTSAPPAPTGLRLVPGGDLMDLYWMGMNDGEGFQSYKAERNPAWPEGTRSLSAQGYGSQEYQDTGLTTSAVYAYRVWAVDRAGNEGPKTEWVSAMAGLATVEVQQASPTVVDFDQAKLVLPPQAAGDDVVKIRIYEKTPEQLTKQPDEVLVSRVFSFSVIRNGPSGEYSDEHADFSKPIGAWIEYDPAKLPEGYNELDIRPYYFDDVWGRWRPVEGSHADASTHRVSFTTTHFCDYSIQATKAQDLSPQELRNVKFSPFATKVAPGAASVSAETGSMSTSFTEQVLPGRNGFDLVLKRVYDTGTAQSDTPPPAGSNPNGKNGDDPWKMGRGWRLQFPSLTWNSSGLWVRGLDGASLALDQAIVTTQQDDGVKKVVSLESHEARDLSFKIEFTKSTGHGWFGIPYNILTFSKAEAFMKDGRRIQFDSSGRVAKMIDSTGLNEVSFAYGTNSITITDSRGRIITCATDGSKITNITVGGPSDCPSSANLASSYAYTDDLLTAATDSGGRTWSYSYVRLSKGSSSKLKDDHSTPTVTTRAADVLSALWGPGIGAQAIAYDVQSYSYDDTPEVTEGEAKTYTMTNSRIVAVSVRCYADHAALVNSPGSFTRETTTLVTFAHAEKSQFLASRSVVRDGRIMTTTDYASFPMTRNELSNASDSSGDLTGVLLGSRKTETEHVALASSIERVTYGLSWGPVDTTTQSWNPSTLKLATQNVVKAGAASNFRRTEYGYDDWGNVTSQIETQSMAGRTTSLTTTSEYYSENGPDVVLPGSRTVPGVTFPPSKTLAGGTFRNLLACRETVASGDRPSPSGGMTSASTTEFVAYTYTDRGQVKDSYAEAADGWAHTGFEYDNAATGQLSRKTAPSKTGAGSGQVTEYAYDSVPGYYRVTTTQKDVDLGGATADIVSRQSFEIVGGNEELNIDPRGYATVTKHDKLGRVTDVYEAADTDLPLTAFPQASYLPGGGSVHTAVTYADDMAAPSAETISPNGLKTKYAFDSRGRLGSVVKTNSVMSSAAAAKGHSSETITTGLDYDEFDQVTAMHGPYSSIEGSFDASRSLATLVTTYDYDGQGRVVAVTGPDKNKKTSIYDDAAGTVRQIDEEGDAVEQTLDWNGKVIHQIAYDRNGNTGNDITVSTYLDGKGRTVASTDPLGRTSFMNYDKLGLECQDVAPARAIASADEGFTLTTATISPTTVKSFYLDGSPKSVSQSIDASAVRLSTNTGVNGLGMVLRTECPVAPGSTRALVAETRYDRMGNKLASISRYSDDTGFAAKSEWTYDSHGRVLSQKDYVSETDFALTTYAYDVDGNKTGMTDPRGNAKLDGAAKYSGDFNLSMAYDMLGRLISASLPRTIGQASRGSIEMAYDGRGNLLRRKDADGSVTAYAYDLRNLLVKETKSGGSKALITTYGYDKAGRLIRKSLPDGSDSVTEYDSFGRVTAEGPIENGGEASDAGKTSQITSYVYDRAGNKTMTANGNGHATVASYNPEGKVLSTRDYADPAGKSWSTVYDAAGQVVRSSDPEGNEQTLRYDLLGRLVAEKNARGGVSTYVYDAVGDILTNTDPRGTTFSRTYSKNKLLLEESAAYAGVSETASFSYDEAGSLVSSSSGGTTSLYNLSGGAYQPDAYGLVTGISQGYAGRVLSSSYRYDALQRMVSAADPAGRTVAYGYNVIGQLETVSDASQAAHPDWISGALSYAPNGQLTGYALADGIVRSFGYDAIGRLSSMDYRLGQDSRESYSYGYDQAGNIKNKRVNGNKDANSYAYDSKERLTQAVEYGYFQKKPSEIDSEIALSRSDRDFDGQGSTIAFSGDSIRLDAASRSVCVDLGRERAVNRIDLVPEAQDYRLEAGDVSLYASIDGVSWGKLDSWRVSSEPRSGGFRITLGRMASARYLKIATSWDDRDFDDQSLETGERPFRNYPAKLIRVWTLSSESQKDYAYDGIGNRVTDDSGRAVLVYEKNLSGGNTTLLSQDATWDYAYDQNGNLVSKIRRDGIAPAGIEDPAWQGDRWEYRYDLRNRLVSAFRDGARVASYTYDASGMRIARMNPDGSSTRFAYSPHGKLVYEQTVKDGVVSYERSMAYLGSTILGWTETVKGVESTYYALTDHLGSVTAIADSSGTLVWKSEFDPFGKLSGVVSSQDFNGIFTGKEVDPDTGLYYFNARWYDPETGRFITEDPARDGVNWYAYCYNNPLRYVDPTGLEVSYGPHGERDNYDPQTGITTAVPDATRDEYEAGRQNLQKVAKDASGLIDNFDRNYSKQFWGSFGKAALTSYGTQLANFLTFGGYSAGNFGKSLVGAISDPAAVIDGVKTFASNVYNCEPKTMGALAEGAVEVAVTGFTAGALKKAGSVSGNVAKVAGSEPAAAAGMEAKIARPYASLADPDGVAAGAEFTAAQKQAIIKANMERNGGVVKSDLSGQTLTKPLKSQKGVTPDPLEWQIDHIDPRVDGGTNSYSNAQVLSRQENRAKWY